VRRFVQYLYNSSAAKKLVLNQTYLPYLDGSFLGFMTIADCEDF
jgi:hypothetical protein